MRVYGCQRLQASFLELEARIPSHLRRDLASGREQLVDTAADAGDASVADESESEDFTEAELDTTTLQQVQAALRRIETAHSDSAWLTEARSS